MQFRLFLPQMRLDFDALVQRAVAAEVGGFGGIALMDHLAPPGAESQPMYEAMVTATFLSARTTSLGIGHLVLCESLRHPAVLAKQAVTLDHASCGRFELGLGWGSVPEELAMFGVGDTNPGMRVRRMSETLDLLKALWSGEEVDFDGEFHSVTAGRQMPTPLTSIPIVIGGVGPKTLDLVARHADWWNVQLNHVARLDDLRSATGEARVSVQQMVALVPDEVSRAQVTEMATRRFGLYGDGLIIGSPAELVHHFSKLQQGGVERTYVWFADFAQPATLEIFGEHVIPHV